MEAKLYFLAFYKHDAPQRLMAGPFVREDTAALARLSHPLTDRLAIVSTTVTVEFEETPGGERL